MNAEPMRDPGAPRALRRARPMLGTLVEIGVLDSDDSAVSAAFRRIADVEAQLSRFDPGSAIFRFNAAPAGTEIAVGIDARRVLDAARTLCVASRGLFDISLGSGRDGWACERGRLRKLATGVALDLGGIGKGYAVDRAVQSLIGHGVSAGWVNAGGDLRVFGPLDVPIDLRDEIEGGVRRFATIGDGAFATSRLCSTAAPRQSAMVEATKTSAGGVAAHVSVAANECLWADALTKIVVATGDADHPLLGRYGARAWLH